MVKEAHPGAVGHAAALAVVANPAGGHQIVPTVLASQPPRDHMIQRQIQAVAPAILASVIVPPENFLLVQFHTGAGALDHALETNDRWRRIDCLVGMDLATPVEQHGSFVGEDQTDRAPNGADIQRLVIRVEDKDGFL